MSASASYSPIVSKLYNSRNVFLELLEARGFDVNDYRGFSVNEIHNIYANKQLDMLFTHPSTKQKVYVKYHLATHTDFKKIKADHIYELIDDLYDEEDVLGRNDELIVISKDKTNDTLKNLMKEVYANDQKFVNIYNFNDYLFNILRHSLVPPHRILSDDEKKLLFQTFNIADSSQLPEIDRFDPVAQAIGMRPEQVCEVTRRSPTSVDTKYYRLCY